jgi:DNA-binding MarR family transcriptional regulator
MPLTADDSASDRSSLAGRLMMLGTQMLKLAGEVSRQEPAEAVFGEAPIDLSLIALLAEEAYRDRRRRARHLPVRLFGEPAWDILLDLYAAAARGEDVSVSNACLAANVPASTALRWVQHLEADGLVERLPDETDARRHYVRLTEAGLERMNAYFAECRGELIGAAAQ